MRRTKYDVTFLAPRMGYSEKNQFDNMVVDVLFPWVAKTSGGRDIVDVWSACWYFMMCYVL